MKKTLYLVLLVFYSTSIFAQADNGVSVISPDYFDATSTLSEILEYTDSGDTTIIPKQPNSSMRFRSHPFSATAKPKHNDPVLQRLMGTKHNSDRDINLTFEGQNDQTYSPWDATGAVGPNHYVQSINRFYEVYDKGGSTVQASLPLSTLFTGLPGANADMGDAIVMFDEQAERWFISEITKPGGAGGNRIMVAMSKTDDPMGEWNRWSYDLGLLADYAKFGISKYSYLFSINNQGASTPDIFAIDRMSMIAGNIAPKLVLLNNSNRPNVPFHAIMPMDSDGSFAPSGPAQYITINDDAWDGWADQLWIYELTVDWSVPEDATFTKKQEIDVPDFDTNFGDTWDNLTQPGTTQKLDAIPDVLMNRAQHLNFGNTESLVCCHTVDVDNSDHAGIRWYELTRDHDGDWSVRQNGTYAPDADSRWIGSIAQNAQHEIGIGYNIVGASTSPGIRYCGQSAAEYANASGVLDIAEVTVVDGTGAINNSNRWGDYANLSIDPHDNHTFWFTSTYTNAVNSRATKITNWEFSATLVVADFKADKLKAIPNETVKLTDLTTGFQNLWSWKITPATYTYVGGTTETDPNPKIKFTELGKYTIQLIVANDNSVDTIIKEDYIEVKTIYAAYEADIVYLTEGDSLLLTNKSMGDPSSYSWVMNGGAPATSTDESPGNIIYASEGIYDMKLTVEKDGDSDIEEKISYVNVCKYCPTIYQDVVDDHISNVLVGSIDNASGSVGYEDYTNLITELEVGTSNLIEVTVTSTGSVQHVFAWVDWNKNCDFEEEGEVFDLGQTSGSSGAEVLNGYISVPADADLTYVRLRVSEKYDVNPEPCENGTYGEAEDYTIKVVSSALPVALTSFYGFPKGKVNKLEWHTASIHNTKHFEIQRSDDKRFERIAIVEAGGNSTVSKFFSYIDEVPLMKGYYRLKIVDFDGSTVYSDIISIQRAISNNKIVRIYPNPVKDDLNVEFLAEKDLVTSMRILTCEGKVVRMQKIDLLKGVNSISLEVPFLPNGQYTIVVDGVNDVIHFIKTE